MCAYLSLPVMQLCVDIHTSAVMHYMRCLSKVIRNKNQIKKELDECQCNHHKLPKKLHWQTYLNKRVEDLVEISY